MTYCACPIINPTNQNNVECSLPASASRQARHFYQRGDIFTERSWLLSGRTRQDQSCSLERASALYTLPNRTPAQRKVTFEVIQDNPFDGGVTRPCGHRWRALRCYYPRNERFRHVRPFFPKKWEAAGPVQAVRWSTDELPRTPIVIDRIGRGRHLAPSRWWSLLDHARLLQLPCIGRTAHVWTPP